MLAFTGNPLDRASAERADPGWIASQRTAAAALFLPIWQAKNIAGGRAGGFSGRRN